MFFGFSNQPKRRGPPVVKKKVKPMNFSGGIAGPMNFGMGGFNSRKKKNSINKGDWDRDGVTNMRDCRPMNHNKHMAFVYNDGGRCKAGYRNRTGDCFLRALAISEGREHEYEKLNKEVAAKLDKIAPEKRGSLQTQKGVRKIHVNKILKDYGYEETVVHEPGPGKRFSMRVNEESLPPGRNIVIVKRHAIATKGKDWYDTSDHSAGGQKGVYSYFTKKNNNERVIPERPYYNEPRGLRPDEYLDLDEVNPNARADPIPEPEDMTPAQDFIDDEPKPKVVKITRPGEGMMAEDFI